jgi:glycine cleavage system H protein
MSKDETIPYMGYEWLQIEDDTITIGVTEEGLSELGDITAVNLPTENEEVVADEVCGEVDTADGPLNLYCPIDGKVVEINGAVIENPQLILEDPTGDGWLFRVEPDDPEALDELRNGGADEDDEEDEDDDDEEDEDDDDDEDEDGDEE